MLSGTGATSIRKQDLTDQKNLATGFVKTQFAHQCSGGETGINLNSLTLPSQMSANGFTNPSGAQLAAANLTTYRKNLKLVSSLRGQLVDFLSYTVSATGTQINFSGFTAQPGEIFVGTLDYTAVNGIQVVSATGQPATGTLAAGATDFNIGYPVPTNQYSTTNLGGVLVYLDGVLQTRNTGNSSTVTDGNYYEVDNGSGNFSIIRFNLADPSQTRNVLVVPNGLLVPQPDGSLLTTVQTLAGQINQLSQYVASLTGQSTSTVLGGAASYTDLLAFGNLVNAINQSAALINKNNSWTAYQNIPGRTDGSTPPTGDVGEVLSQTRLRSSGLSLTSATSANVTATPLTLTPGRWKVWGTVNYSNGSITPSGTAYAAISLTSATLPASTTYGVQDANGQIAALSPLTANADNTIHTGYSYINLTSSTTFYLIANASFSGSSSNVNGSIYAERLP